jgi:hypothetical protein
MSQGGGKYGRQVDLILKALDADVVLLIVGGGKLGSGFSVTCRSPSYLLRFSSVLRDVADQIEADIARLPEPP